MSPAPAWREEIIHALREFVVDGASRSRCSVRAALAQERRPGEKWQSVAKTDNQEAFVNTTSVAVGGYLEARVKQNYALPQPAAKKGKTYLSSRRTYRFDCAQRRMA